MAAIKGAETLVVSVMLLKPVKKMLNTLRPVWPLTYFRQLVFSGGQHVLENQQQDGNGQEYGHFEAQLFTSGLADEKGGQIQDQKIEQGHDKNDHIKHWLPSDVDLRKHSQINETKTLG